jgi:hypothetical protein
VSCYDDAQRGLTEVAEFIVKTDEENKDPTLSPAEAGVALASAGLLAAMALTYAVLAVADELRQLRERR